MKKYYYLLLFAMVVSAMAQAQTGWVTQKLDNKLSVKFPAEPQKTAVNGMENYTSKTKDSVVYTAAVADLEVLAQLDSAMLAPMIDKPQFAEGIKKGIASKRPNYTFGDVTIGKWKTYTCYTVSGTENTNKTKALAKIILIGSKMYTLICQVPSKLATADSEVFFGSADLVR